MRGHVVRVGYGGSDCNCFHRVDLHQFFDYKKAQVNCITTKSRTIPNKNI